MRLVCLAALLVQVAPAAAFAQIEPLPPLPPLSTIEPFPGETTQPGQAALPGQPMPELGPADEYFDLDAYLAASAGPTAPGEDWSWQLLPSGLIYKAYLADPKESRLGTQIFHDEGDGNLWDTTLGGHVGLIRLGTVEGAWPQGWQLDLEGSGQIRLDPDDERDMRAADFRCGIPLTYGYGRQRWKFGYYHLSSHTGDEYQVKNPDYERLNYVRDTMILGYAYYWTDNLRLYGEVGWAGIYADVSKEWEFRFGVDYAPSRPTGLAGAPFFAVHGHLQEELDYSGSFVLQAGWAWRGDRTSHLLRAGLHYFNGMSNQYSFYNQFEHQIGAGVWYDF
ncbi:MAG: DUF1207 domain-containing protein [Pirellulaceae bacterium]